MIFQDHDPHHMAPDFNTFYYFLLLAPVVVAITLFIGWRVLKHSEHRKADGQGKESEESKSKTMAERKGDI